MAPKQIISVLLACLVLGALGTSAAQAGQWTVGTEENQTKGGTTLTGPETVTLEKHPGTELTMSTVLLGVPLSLTAGNVTCRMATSCTLSTAKEGTTVRGEGAIEFTEVKASVSGCSVAGNRIVTELLTQQGIMDPTAGSTVVFDRFVPQSGTISVVEFKGAECPFAGAEVVIKGTVCGEVVHTNTPGTYTSSPTGTLFKVQTLRFGKEQQSTAGCAEMTFGKSGAQLTGAVDNKLSGANSSKPFGAD
jgi:hypothetical protein